MLSSAFIAVIGRPSAGKSTLVNTLCGHKVSIVSPVPQTTRNAVRGIRNEERGQLVFVDTPGFHDSAKKFNKNLTSLVKAALDDCDAVLYLVDSTRPLGEEEGTILGMLAGQKLPVLVGLNKQDLVEKSAQRLLETQNELKSEIQAKLPEAKIFTLSALQKTGTANLLTALYACAPQGQAWYPAEYYTDQDPAFRIAEIIREQVMNRTLEEIPHASFVEIEDLELKDKDGKILSHSFSGDDALAGDSEIEEDGPRTFGTDLVDDEDDTVDELPAGVETKLADISDYWDLPPAERPKLWIRAVIHVERESQKGIVIGKGGELVRTMRLEAEKELREIFPYRIALDLRVKVSPKWRSDEKIIKQLIH